ncbi:small secreted protein [Apiospora arundinis]|uniref:Small secreted protein n=1 Tax=Apiospora arundinis TaxID=335852 RepID=A0ABR2HR86_9PEZI
MHLSFLLSAAWAPAAVLSLPTTASLQPLEVADIAIAVETATNKVTTQRSTQQWTMRSVRRACAQGNSFCVWQFGIDTNDGSTPVQPCSFRTPGQRGSSAKNKCGPFKVGSGWAQQGFTVMSVVKDGLIIYPAYSDQRANTGQVITPDQSYTPKPVP